MAEFKPIVITKKGQALMSKLLAGASNVKFLRIAVSDTDYQDSQLEDLTALSSIKQTADISKITRNNTDSTSISIHAAIDNKQLKQGYYMRTVGVYANDPDSGEILYAVFKASVPGWMPAYAGQSVSGSVFDLSFSVGNANGITVVLGGTAVATMLEINELENEIADVKSYVGYTGNDVYGLEVDYENSVYRRLGGAVNKNAGADFDSIKAFGGRKRCNVTDNGVVTAYYGDEAYTETGVTQKDITVGSVTITKGTPVQVMVEQPKFYYKVIPLKMDPQTKLGYNLRKARYYISDIPKNGFKIHPAFVDASGQIMDKIYLGAYEACLYDASGTAYVKGDDVAMDAAADKLSSISGVRVASGLTNDLTRSNCEKMAKNRGDGWHIITVNTVAMQQLLMIIEAGTMNTQKAYGAGINSVTDVENTNVSSYTGSTAYLGNNTGSAKATVEHDGTTSTAEGHLAVSYRGVENPYGNMWHFFEGLNIWGDGSMEGGVPFICTNYDYNEQKNDGNYESVGFNLQNGGSWISAMGYSAKYDYLFIGSEYKGGSESPVGDPCWTSPDLKSYNTAFVGGFCFDRRNVGAFYSALNNWWAYRYRLVSSRLAYFPPVTALRENK